MTIEQLALRLAQLGCPPEKCAAMAAQLDKRAAQLAAREGRPQDEALAHLLQLMQAGWAAPQRGAS